MLIPCQKYTIYKFKKKGVHANEIFKFFMKLYGTFSGLGEVKKIKLSIELRTEDRLDYLAFAYNFREGFHNKSKHSGCLHL